MTEETAMAILKQLEAIESLLRQLPEVQAATFLLMQQQVQEAAMKGEKVSDIFSLNWE